MPRSTLAECLWSQGEWEKQSCHYALIILYICEMTALTYFQEFDAMTFSIFGKTKILIRTSDSQKLHPANKLSKTKQCRYETAVYCTVLIYMWIELFMFSFHYNFSWIVLFWSFFLILVLDPPLIISYFNIYIFYLILCFIAALFQLTNILCNS